MCVELSIFSSASSTIFGYSVCHTQSFWIACIHTFPALYTTHTHDIVICSIRKLVLFSSVVGFRWNLETLRFFFRIFCIKNVCLVFHFSSYLLFHQLFFCLSKYFFLVIFPADPWRWDFLLSLSVSEITRRKRSWRGYKSYSIPNISFFCIAINLYFYLPFSRLLCAYCRPFNMLTNVLLTCYSLELLSFLHLSLPVCFSFSLSLYLPLCRPLGYLLINKRYK